MSSRMTKYYDDEEIKSSRYHKNEELYREISKSELNGYDIKSNATILGDNKNEIDVEKIKKILDTKYNETPKRRSIRLEEPEEIEEKLEITKEYDINVILEKAREQKTENYEEERLKKLRDTQFDILKNLNIDKYTEKEEENSSSEEDLQTLINTITFNENHKKFDTTDSNPLDILSELKGSDNTEVLDGLKEEVENAEKESKITDTQMINSFYTSSNALNQKDFEDIDDDFSKGLDSNNTFVKIIIALVTVIFLVGVILIIKSIYF